MNLFFLIVLGILTVVAAVESLLARPPFVAERAALTGVAVGAFAWQAVLYWPVFPAVSVVMLLLGGALAMFRAFRDGGETVGRILGHAALVLTILFVGWQGILLGFVNRELVSEVAVLNPQGTASTAFVAYHPGKSGVQELLADAFSTGLVDEGWRVERTTVSVEAPADLSGYDLVVLGTPVYDWRPSRRILKYLETVGNLEGIPVVAILSGEGCTRVAERQLALRIREAGGDLVAILPVWLLAPNTPRYGTEDLVTLMRTSARDIARQLAAAP